MKISLKGIRDVFQADKGIRNIVLICITFSIIYSVFSVLKFLSMNATGYDLGIFSQALWSTIHGRPFYSNLIGENFLSEHFSLIMYFFLFFYYINPSPITLLVLQSVFVSFSALPIYLISIRVFSKSEMFAKRAGTLALLFSISFLLSPYTLSAIYFDFHFEAFLPFFFFLSIYAFLYEKRALSLFSLIMVITLVSDFVYVVWSILIFEFLYLLLYKNAKVEKWLFIQSTNRLSHNVAQLVGLSIIFYAFLVLAGFLKTVISGSAEFSAFPGNGGTGTPFTSIDGLFSLLATNPSVLLSSLLVNWQEKFYFLFFLVGSLIFFPFLSLSALLTTIPYLMYAMPSSYQPYYHLGFQYASLILGPAYLSAILGLSNFGKIIQKHTYPKSPRHRHKGSTYVLTILVAIVVIMVPLRIITSQNSSVNSDYNQLNGIFDQSNPSIGFYLLEVQKNISPNAYILTQNNIMPFFSNDINAYSTPWSPGVIGNMSKFQYIIYQKNSYWANASSDTSSLESIANSVLANHTFFVYLSDKPENIYVLKRVT